MPNTAYLRVHPSKRQRLTSPAAEDGNSNTATLEDSHSPVLPSAGKGVVEDLQERVARLERALLAHAPESDGELIAPESATAQARSDEHEQQVQIPAVSTNLSSQVRLNNSYTRETNHADLSSFQMRAPSWRNWHMIPNLQRCG